MLRSGFTEQADIWSSGVIIFKLLTSKMPFKVGKKVPPKRLVPQILDIERVIWPFSISDEARNLIKACLQYEAANRPTPREGNLILNIENIISCALLLLRWVGGEIPSKIFKIS